MIFNHDDELAERLIKKWKEMGNNFIRFFLNLSTPNQKEMLDYLQIPIALNKPGNTDSPHYDSTSLLPDGLEDINHLLFYFHNRALDENIAGVKLPHLPGGMERKISNGSSWADYMISLSYDEQVFVILLILQN